MIYDLRFKIYAQLTMLLLHCCVFISFAHAQQEIKDTTIVVSDSLAIHHLPLTTHQDTSFYSDTTLWTTYKVQLNNTLFIIAKKHNMKMAELIEANKLTSYNLVVGQILKVRKKQTAGKKQSSSAVVHAKTSSYHPKYKVIKYKIKTGDTVFSIAKEFDMSEEELMKLNNVSTDSLLYILQVVKVKAPKE